MGKQIAAEADVSPAIISHVQAYVMQCQASFGRYQDHARHLAKRSMGYVALPATFTPSGDDGWHNRTFNYWTAVDLL